MGQEASISLLKVAITTSGMDPFELGVSAFPDFITVFFS